MVTASRGTASSASRFAVLAIALFSLSAALASCGQPAQLPKAPQSEAEKRDDAPPAPPTDGAPQAGDQKPGEAMRPPLEEMRRIEEQRRQAAAEEYERRRAAEQSAKQDRDAGEAGPSGGAPPPANADAPAPLASPPKKSAAARPYRYEAPGDAPAQPPPPSGGQGAPPPVADAPWPDPPSSSPPAMDVEPGGYGGGGGGGAGPSGVPVSPSPPPPVATAPPRMEPARSASEPPGPGMRRLGEAERPRTIAPTAPSPVAFPPAADEPAKEFDVVPVFFGTDRGVEADPVRLRYGPERGHKLQLGRAMITVPTAHKVPNIERPWIVEVPYFKVKIYEEKEDPAKHFTVQEIAAMTEAQVLALVKGRLKKSVDFKDHAIVFVHGFNTSFDNALYRTAQIAYDLKFDGAPFVYSWPSGGKVASYTYDRGSAEAAEPHLADFLEFVVKKSGAKSISLIAHSMGNELLLRVLERARPVAPPGVVISQVILAAPDVDRDKFANIAKQITTFSKGVTLYAASNDRALGYSARFWGGVPRAGDVPASGPMIVVGVDTIDVTSVSTDALGLNHSGYAENPELLNDVKALIQNGVRPPDKRIKNLLTVESPGGVFWRYPPPPPR